MPRERHHPCQAAGRRTENGGNRGAGDDMIANRIPACRTAVRVFVFLDEINDRNR